MATSGLAALAFLALAVLCQPCLAAADADCKAEEQDESALLAHRSASVSAHRQEQAANSTKTQKCGLLYIADTSTCCTDSRGNGLGFGAGSICCQGPSGGVIGCGAGSVCNTESGLCFAPGSQNCGSIACAAGTECWEPTNTCYVPIPNTVKCGKKTMIQCAAGGVCCGNGTAPLCGGKGSFCCYNSQNFASLCAPGSKCTSEGLCLAD